VNENEKDRCVAPIGECMNNERKAFEKWYVANAFDYENNPIGSRECALQWKAWQAALSTPADGGEQAVAWGVFWDDSGPLRIAHGWKFPVFKEKEAAEQFAYNVCLAEDGGPVKVLPLGLLSPSPAANIQARDAERYRIARRNIAPARLAESLEVDCPDLEHWETLASRVDSLCDAAIAASKGTDNGEGDERE
jgi:hypothetical protein